MKIRGIVWLDSIVEKIGTKHGVSQEEVRQIFQGHVMFRFVEKGHRQDENVYAALGRTKAGRYVVVFFVHKTDQRMLILTARDMTVAERRRYEKK
ncbi:MAG TPA: BrnT family toxin [Sedimentisphaerales bacterium]|nr:BrnT family toxin [Sedimentisphaerales bacterium]